MWIHRYPTRLLLALAALLAATVATFAGAAQSKEDMQVEMISIAHEIDSIEGLPAKAARLADLRDRYDRLSAALSGDDPGSDFDDVFSDSAPLAAPPAPANCSLGGADTFTSTVNAPIDDATPVQDTQAVSGLQAYIWDVDVVVDISHTFAADLEFTVTSPAGTVVTLSTDNGGDNEDVFTGTILDDDAGDTNAPGPVNDVIYADNTTEPTVAPEEPLAAFLGEDPNGDWTLDVADDAAGNSGTVNSWSLVITTLATAPIDDPPVSASNAPGLPIDEFTAAVDALTIGGAGSFLCGATLTTDITHTSSGNLQIFLTSPVGTVLTVSTGNGGSNDDVFSGSMWFDDAGDTNPPGGVNDVTYADGVPETPIATEEALGALIGEIPNGLWILAINDTGTGESGTLNSWGLEITTCACGQPESDLEVVKTGALDPGDPSQAIWTIGVQNHGPDDATGVMVTDALDSCSTYVSDDCGGMNAPPWIWNVGGLPSGAVAFCNVTADVSGCSGTVPNTAVVSGDQTDPVPGNNQSTTSLETSALAIPTLGAGGLALLVLVLASGSVLLIRRHRPPGPAAGPGL